MSKGVELLNTLTATSNITRLANESEEQHIIIDNDRFITVPDELKRIAVQYDHNIETVTFDCPRYWDEHDMSEMSVYINYLRADNTPGVYKAKNVRTDETDTSIMHFEWTITKNATMSAGSIVFLICIKRVGEDGVEENHWNSELCKDCYISAGLEIDGNVSEEIRPDIIENWYREVTAVISEVEAVRDDIISMRDNGEFDGVGISSIKQTTTSTEDGGENVFSVTLTNGLTKTFRTRNGSQGAPGTEVPVARGYGDGITYTASGNDLPEVSTAATGAGVYVGKGRQIIFIPEIYPNNSDAPTLSLNDGEAIPIRLRGYKNRGDNDSKPDATTSVPIGALMVGVPYTMTFCGKFWLVDSFMNHSKLICATNETEASYMRNIADRLIGLAEGDTIGVPIVNSTDGNATDVSTAYIRRSDAEETNPNPEGNVEIPTVGKVEEMLKNSTSTEVDQTDSNAVHYTAEVKTESEKAQARKNIDAIGSADAEIVDVIRASEAAENAENDIDLLTPAASKAIAKSVTRFDAVYGVTTFAEIDDAFNAKIPVFLRLDVTNPNSNIASTVELRLQRKQQATAKISFFHFYAEYSEIGYFVRLRNNDVWGDVAFRFYSQSINEASPSDFNYPSEKAIVNYINAKLGGA